MGYTWYAAHERATSVEAYLADAAGPCPNLVPPARADCARRISDLTRRAKALGGLASHLPEADGPAARARRAVKDF
ncbi:MAG TPA: hypothetical protein VHZ03_22760 [Trebonia sp.]|jgi:hypothetical protein|nr:hypothetical protein [Trebonia sp.]